MTVISLQFPTPNFGHRLHTVIPGRTRKHSFTNISLPCRKRPREAGTILEYLLPSTKAMHAGEDGSKDASVRHPETFSPAAVTGIVTESWYNRLNEEALDAAFIPFVDDDPPFLLQGPSSDEGSIQAIPEERRSSRPGQNSQPQPLSHSLLSQLELGESDPNTFRDIIDDLTVQNKKLKRHLRRYKKYHSTGKEHDGLFEVRMYNLSPEKKHELQTILQDFASNMYSTQPESAPQYAVSESQSLPHDSIHKPIPPAHRFTENPDSAYASVSATNVTAQTVSAPSERSKMEFYNPLQLESERTPYSHHRSPQAPQQDPDETPDTSKQELVAKKLEQLFIGGPNDLIKEGLLHPGDFPADVPQLKDIRGNSVKRLPLPFVGDNVSSSNRNGARPDPVPSDRVEGKGKGIAVPGASIHEHHLEVEHTDESDHLRYLRQLGVASPIAESSSEYSPEWLYLNLLINMAELHTLNVTPEYVRQAIRLKSTRLVLSEDGRKVRWHRNILYPGRSSDKTLERAPMHDLKSSLAPQQAGEESNLRPPSSPRVNYFALATRASNHPRVASGKLPLANVDYKPMFVHRRRLPTKWDRGDNDNRSVESENSSSVDEDASTGSGNSRTKADLRKNGPMIFLNHSPFFLDLSADSPDTGSMENPLYASLLLEPLGRLSRTAVRSNEDDEKPSAFVVTDAAGDVTITPVGRGSSPPLKIYDTNPTHPPAPRHVDSTSQDTDIHLEASGIGGIHLDDNFAIANNHTTTPKSPTA
ncbi:MAG: hypothetical protein Q9182_006477 [Xanthomendoza sp. 2 TL-2023]